MSGGADTRDERGFTLVELIITVSIMGFITAALATVLVQGFTMSPQTTNRTAYAGAESRLVNALSDDIANAASITHSPSNSNASMDCTDRIVGPLDNFMSAGGLPRVDGGPTPFYFAWLVDARDPYKRADVYRWVVGTPWPGQLILTGYCVEGTTAVVSYTYVTTDPTMTFTLRLQPSLDTEVREISIGGDRRTTG